MENMGVEFKSFYNNKKVLITGHTGFKGSWLCSILLELRAKVCGIGLEPNTTPALFNLLNLNEKIESHIVDIRNFEEVYKVFNNFKPEIVFHLAAQPLVIDSYQNPRYTYDVNVMGTVNICECIRLSNFVKSFINVTTDKVYENPEQEDYSFIETDRLNGFDPYSNSKSCSELVTQCYNNSFFKDSNVSVSTCRAGNVIGGGDFSDNRIIPDCIKSAMNKETISVRNPNSIRPYQHVLEADFFYILLAMKQYNCNEFSGNYNIGPNSTDCLTTGEICDLFCKEWGNSIAWNTQDVCGPHEASFLKLDCHKAKNVLKWQPIWNVDIAIIKVIEWSKVFESNLDIADVTDTQIKKYLEKIDEKSNC